MDEDSIKEPNDKPEASLTGPSGDTPLIGSRLTTCLRLLFGWPFFLLLIFFFWPYPGPGMFGILLFFVGYVCILTVIQRDSGHPPDPSDSNRFIEAGVLIFLSIVYCL